MARSALETAGEFGECRPWVPRSPPVAYSAGPVRRLHEVSTLAGSIPLLTIVDAIASLITVSIQQAPVILPAGELAFIVEARSLDGANRTVMIGDIRRKVIAVRKCANHRVTLPRNSIICRHHCGRGRALSVLRQRRFGVVVH